jgi:hypothetical protein
LRVFAPKCGLPRPPNGRAERQNDGSETHAAL